MERYDVDNTGDSRHEKTQNIRAFRSLSLPVSLNITTCSWSAKPPSTG